MPRWEKGPWEEGASPVDEIISRIKDAFGRRKGKLPLFGIILAILVVLWLASGIYIVSPAEQGVIRRFGEEVRITSPGLHYRLPWPIEKVDTPKVTEVKRFEVGFRTVDPGPPARYETVPSESLMLTGDENIVNCQIIVQYKIKDASDYLFKVKNPEKAIRDASEVALRQVIGGSKIDDALTVGKAKIQEDTRIFLQRLMDSYQSGILVTEVKLQDVSPPREVDSAFKDVVSAKEDRERVTNEAKGYWEDIIPKARGKSEEIMREAEGYKQERIKRAQGDAHRFLAVLREYEKSEEVTKKRLYLETMEEILPGIQKFVIDSKVGGNLLPFLPLGEIKGLPPKEKEK